MNDIVIKGTMEQLSADNVRLEVDFGWHMTLRIDLYHVDMETLESITNAEKLMHEKVKIIVERRYEYD